tara:strand:+ start:3148 stop:3411 length:264 start_codon:yes stop_codon:yes gene_type:complete
LSEVEQASLTYSTDEGVYDVGKLDDEARVAFGYLVEVQKELQVLNLRSNVLQAAQQTFNKIIQSNLDDEALTPNGETNGADDEAKGI